MHVNGSGTACNTPVSSLRHPPARRSTVRPEDSRPPAKPTNVMFWADRPSRLDELGLREFERELRRDWSEESLGPVLEAIAVRREEIARRGPVPTCVYCHGPCDKPFGWFAVERLVEHV